MELDPFNLQTNDFEKLNELKRFLFEENIRLEVRKKELDDLHEKFLEERVTFVEEMKEINLRNVNERKRLKEEELFFDKKMDILKSGFAALEDDRKKFEKEKAEFRAANSSRGFDMNGGGDEIPCSLFVGVNNFLALKKRYRDLLKIFHPDNLCGDTEMVTYITTEYERLKEKFDYPFKNVK